MVKSDLQLFMDGMICKKNQTVIERHCLQTTFKRMRKKKMTIYKHDKKSEKAVIFLSGGVELRFASYIQKLIDDLSLKNCDILVFEKLSAFNLTYIQNIVAILQTMGYSEITIVGFSMGGVIGSHVMSGLNHLDIKKTLICIDTPFHIHSTIPLAFEQNFCIWRPDIYVLYKNTVELIQPKYHYYDVFQITTLEQYKRYNSEHFGVTNYEFLSSMNPDIKNAKVISFYNEEDPVVIRHFNIPIVDNYLDNLDKSSKFKEIRIKHCGPGHCTEWMTKRGARKFVRQLRIFI
jgi:hypothetical protein